MCVYMCVCVRVCVSQLITEISICNSKTSNRKIIVSYSTFHPAPHRRNADSDIIIKIPMKNIP